ncbi:MAG: ATP-binding protein [Thermodesulfovibrionales bacterium]|nr:ATP-binding protein [Thermodesulfovibrionales bacterium]
MAAKTTFFSNIRQIFLSFVEKYHPFNIKYFKALVGIIMTLLMGTVLILGWLSSQKVKEIVTEDFNQQQLVLARHAATQIENSIESLKRELQLLSISPSLQYIETTWLINRMDIAFSSIKHEGTLEIRLIEPKNERVYHVTDQHVCSLETMDPDDASHIAWAQKKENIGQIIFTSISTMQFNGDSPRPIMRMVIPVWQISVDESHPVATNKFSGVLVFVLDVSRLIGNINKEIRSGKTGYSWVIDENGTFLYHQDESFIGKNAFEARKGKKPTISFARINEIQKDKMLKGEEGTSWYISGWHRGVEGEIKKLIAYTPISFDEKEKGRIWSVAVVAPVSEIEGPIHEIQQRQMLLQALIIFLILFGGLFINFMILSWSNTLEQEVTKKTIELKKSEQRYKSLIENAEDIIFTVDYNGNFLSINKYGADFFKKNEPEVIGLHLSEIFAWPSGEVIQLMIRKVFDAQESRHLIHMVIIEDQQYWFSTNLRRLWDETGNIYAVLGISRDITERKKMEEHSYYTEKLASMGTLAAGVAHEINNPLTVILGFTDMLIEKAPPDSEAYDLLKTIERQGLNAKRVVENLLSFARHKEHRLEEVDLNKNIETVLAVMGNTLTLSKITIFKNLKTDLPMIRGDSGELQQVFFNIINNAIHAMKGGGTLTITTNSLPDEKVTVRIADSGHGIKPDHRGRIFDPLFTTKEVGQGTGLGLSVSYGIITKHGGSITFETQTKEESDNPGTVFIVTIPIFQKKKTEQ